MTQTWLADEVVGGDRPSYEPVFCLACSQQHFISVATGRALGDTARTVTATHGPAFPPKQIRSVSPRDTDGLRAEPTARSAGHAKAY